MLVPPLELESNVSLWLSAVSQYKARVTFCSYSVMELCTRGLGAQTSVLRVRPYGRPPTLPVPQECAPVGPRNLRTPRRRWQRKTLSRAEPRLRLPRPRPAGSPSLQPPPGSERMPPPRSLQPGQGEDGVAVARAGGGGAGGDPLAHAFLVFEAGARGGGALCVLAAER